MALITEYKSSFRARSQLLLSVGETIQKIVPTILDLFHHSQSSFTWSYWCKHTKTRTAVVILGNIPIGLQSNLKFTEKLLRIWPFEEDDLIAKVFWNLDKL
jgi:hypothetical protein